MVGCGGGGASGVTPGESETTVGSVSVRSLGEIGKPVTVSGIGATSIGFAGNIRRINWTDLNETGVRDEVVFIADDPITGSIDLKITSTDKRFTGTVAKGVLPGPTQFGKGGTVVYALQKGSTGVEVVEFDLVGGGSRVRTNGVGDITDFAVSPNDALVATRRVGSTQIAVFTTVTDAVTVSGSIGTTAMSFSPDGRRLFFATTDAGQNRLVNAPTDALNTSSSGLVSSSIQKMAIFQRGGRTGIYFSDDADPRLLRTALLNTSLFLTDTPTNVSTFSPAVAAVQMAAGADRFVVSTNNDGTFVPTGQVFISAPNGRTQTQQIANGRFGSMVAKASAPVEIIATPTSLMGGETQIRAAIVTTTAQSAGAGSFGSAVVARSLGNLPLTIFADEGSSSGAQHVFTVAVTEPTDRLRNVRYINSIYGASTNINFGNPINVRQAVVIIDARTGALSSVVGLDADGNAAPQIRRQGDRVTVEGSIVGVWSAQGLEKPFSGRSVTVN